MCYPGEEERFYMEKLAIFYNPAQTVRDNSSFSPSAGKPEHVVNLFSKNARVKVVSTWNPLSEQDICVAHDPQMVRDILSCERSNGFGNKLPSVAASLPYTTGSFFYAAKYAIENKTVSMSPTSGFHHSGYDSCHGFCTFNGLMIAAFLLQQRLGIQQVGIVDFDAHYGDGTVDIIETVKGGKELIEHLTFGGFSSRNMDFNKWLDGLEDSLTEQFYNSDVMFYQAGADPHIEDPLGGYLTTQQMHRRDEIVFKVARKLGKPIVWNLAGGYQTPLKKVLDIHQNTLHACIDYYLDAT